MCDVFTRVANLFFPGWQICKDVLSRAANLYVMFCPKWNSALIFSPGWQIYM